MSYGPLNKALVHITPYHIWWKRYLIQLKLIPDVPVEEETQPEEIYFETDEEYLKSLDPRRWKEQDHYRVLGLGKRRFAASDEEIKQAYKKLILTHHPDKRGVQNKDDETDYFSCITKAFQILGDPIKRRSYDSVDDSFDDSVPPINSNSKENFYTVFGPVFARNSRWSDSKYVPQLGNDFCTKEYVENFYHFWYNFESWREYSYLDEEDKERGQDRSERKWIERQNKLERQKKKKEELARIRKLVDNAYACDPRIIRFKEEAKNKKLMEKKAKEEARKLKQEEEERRKKEQEEAILKKKQEEEEALKAKREQEKKEKEAAKKRRKKDVKQIESIFEEYNYFASNDNQKINYIQELNKICFTFSNIELSEFKENLLKGSSQEDKKSVFLSKINKIKETEKGSLFVGQKSSETSDSKETTSTKVWSAEDVQLLVKAVNLFPAGTLNRWEVVAAFVNQHSTHNKNRKAREVLTQAKDIGKIDTNLKQELNRISVTKLLENNKPTAKVEETSQRYETPPEEPTNSEPWTNVEQQLLEQALKSYPASTTERWEKIAECIPGRSKKDCIKRYKELVELVKAKKAAKEAVHTSVKK